jgi:hypothetical protein
LNIAHTRYRSKRVIRPYSLITARGSSTCLATYIAGEMAGQRVTQRRNVIITGGGKKATRRMRLAADQRSTIINLALIKGLMFYLEEI